MARKILIVDDEPAIVFGYSRYLQGVGYEARGVNTLAEASAALEAENFDAVLLDMNLPDGNGLKWLPEVNERFPTMSVIVITGEGDVPEAVEAMRQGADNFLTKPVSMKDLEVYLQKSLEVGRLRRSDLVRQRLERRFEPFVGQSKAMEDVMELAGLAAHNDAPVLLEGETGTGKGVVARWIHDNSKVYGNAFVEVNCSSLRGEMLASELFGHTKGAFTSAVSDKQGLIEVADGGTLFFDEIGDMDESLQAYLLKVIEDKSFRRIGEVKLRKSNFRLICATNRDLKLDVEAGRFRKDLYFRINLLNIVLPPLRERGGDLPGFVSYISRELGRPDVEWSDEVLQLLGSYDWPGNARELKNIIERALLISRGGTPGVECFSGLVAGAPPARAAQLKSSGTSGIRADKKSLDQVEYDHIVSVIEQCGSDVNKAAEKLGISRSTIYRKLKRGKG